MPSTNQHTPWTGSVLKGSKFIIISVHLISNVFAEQNQFPINSHCICVLWFDLEACGETPFGSTGTQRGRCCWGEVGLMCQKCYCVRLIYWVSFTSPNVPRYLFKPTKLEVQEESICSFKRLFLWLVWKFKNCFELQLIFFFPPKFLVFLVWENVWVVKTTWHFNHFQVYFIVVWSICTQLCNRYLELFILHNWNHTY